MAGLKTVNVHRFLARGLATERYHWAPTLLAVGQMNTDIHRVHIAYRKALTPEASWESFDQMDVSGVDLGIYGKKGD